MERFCVYETRIIPIKNQKFCDNLQAKFCKNNGYLLVFTCHIFRANVSIKFQPFCHYIVF